MNFARSTALRRRTVVRVVAFGYTPRQPSSTEVLMRLTGLAVTFALGLFSAVLATDAQPTGKRQSKDFPGDVVFVERIDEMTDERICSVHTPMRGAEAVVSGTSVVFFVHERRGPVARDPAPTVRLGQNKPLQLLTTDRPYLIAAPKDRAKETIEALYTQSRVIVRWYDIQREQHTIALEIGDFGAAYDHAVAACGWPRLAVKRGAFISRPAPPSDLTPPPPSSDLTPAWYVRSVNAKIKERWAGKAIPGKQPAVVFEIRRDGQLDNVVIETSSGNPYYDQAAIRAIREASPFPPLPTDFQEPTLRIKLQFSFDSERG